MRTSLQQIEDATSDILHLAAELAERVEELEGELLTSADQITDLEHTVAELGWTVADLREQRDQS